MQRTARTFGLALADLVFVQWIASGFVSITARSRGPRIVQFSMRLRYSFVIASALSSLDSHTSIVLPRSLPHQIECAGAMKDPAACRLLRKLRRFINENHAMASTAASLETEMLHSRCLHRNDSAECFATLLSPVCRVRRCRWHASLKQAGLDDYVHNAGFILKAEKDKSLCGSWTLPGNDASCHLQQKAIALCFGRCGIEDTNTAASCSRWNAMGCFPILTTAVAEICVSPLARRHRRQGRGCCLFRTGLQQFTHGLQCQFSLP